MIIEHDQIRQAVRQRYAQAAGASSCASNPASHSCGCHSQSGCCGSNSSNTTADEVSKQLGYDGHELQGVPEGANLGLGCGNPQAIAELKPGEIVLDLGCGGGLDCFLASAKVGQFGRIIGVDMTPEMVSQARSNVVKSGRTNIEIRLGEIENLPVADHSVDVVISNCVINLSPDKPRVLDEAFRVLKAGGRLAVSDVVRIRELPAAIRENMEFYTRCSAGAVSTEELEAMLSKSGFTGIQIIPKTESAGYIHDWSPDADLALEHYIVSADIRAVKKTS